MVDVAVIWGEGNYSYPGSSDINISEVTEAIIGWHSVILSVI